jgi:hypothetical protein
MATERSYAVFGLAEHNDDDCSGRATLVAAGGGAAGLVARGRGLAHARR